MPEDPERVVGESEKTGDFKVGNNEKHENSDLG